MANTFINFGPKAAPGESLQPDHLGTQGWSEITDFSFSITAEHSYGNTGLSASLPESGEVSFTHNFNSSSTAMLEKLVAGVHFEFVTIEMLKSTGAEGGAARVFFQIKMASVFVTSITTKGMEDGTLTQDVEFVFKKVFVGYKPQDDQGPLGAAIAFDWHVAGQVLGTDIPEKLR